MVRGALAGALITVLLCQAAPAADPITIRIASSYPPDAAILPGTEVFTSAVNRQLDGVARVEWMPSVPDPLIALRSGNADLAVVPTAAFAGLRPNAIGLFDIPFVFNDLNEATRLQVGGLGEALLSSLVGDDLVGLGYWNLGMQRVYGRQITQAADFKGLKVRTTASGDTQVGLRALGATTVPIAFGEVYQALQAGVVDASEASPHYLVATRQHEVTRSVLGTPFAPQTAVVVASKASWAKFPFRVQAVLADQVKTRAAALTREAVNRDNVALVTLKERGTPTAFFSASDLAGAREIVLTAWSASPDTSKDPLAAAALTVVAASRSQPPPPPPPAPASTGRQPTIFFATDRKRDASQPPEFQFGAERGDTVTYGWLDLSFGRGSAQTMTSATEIKQVHAFADANAFAAAVGEKLKSAQRKDVLVYAHGFYNTFNEAVEAGSFLAKDMKFEGVAVVFSWPSAGLALNYFADEDQAAISIERNSFAQVLEAIRKANGIDHIHVLAHSMGGRIVAGTLKGMTGQSGTNQPPVHDAVFAAPDVNSTIFRDSITKMSTMTHRVTLYASSYDQALICSNYLHGGPRAGEAGSTMVVDQHIETVDVTEAEPRKSWYQNNRLYWFFFESCREGHSYVTRNDKVLGDLYTLVKFNAKAADRRGLEERQLPPPYWAFP